MRTQAGIIYVKNLPADMTGGQIQEFFETYGQVKFVEVKKEAPKQRTYSMVTVQPDEISMNTQAKVTFCDIGEAKIAVQKVNGMNIKGFRIDARIISKQD